MTPDHMPAADLTRWRVKAQRSGSRKETPRQKRSPIRNGRGAQDFEQVPGIGSFILSVEISDFPAWLTLSFLI